MKIKNNERIIFIGDSITDCSRGRPIGIGDKLGNGYVSIISNRINARFPERNIEVLNLGSNGNRVTDLLHRSQRDIIDLKPDWLAISIGINDVWRQFDRPLDPNQVIAEIFKRTYQELIQKTGIENQNLILLSPYFLETDRHHPMRIKMDLYRGIVKDLTAEFEASYIDLQNAFDRYLQFCPQTTISSDQIHLNQIGHTIIADAIFQGLSTPNIH